MTIRPLVIGAALVFAASAPAAGQGGPFLEVSGDLSPVTISGTDVTWQVAHVAGGVQRDGQHGWMVMADRHQRDRLIDLSLGASGFRRMDRWTIYGAAAFVHDPHFLYEQSVEGEISRIFGTVVTHLGYRHLEFPDTRVGMLQPGLSWYLPRAVLEARSFLVRNLTRRTDDVTFLGRGSFDATQRVTLRAGFARGARIFDVSSFSNTDADAWVAFGSVRFTLAPQWTVEVGVGGAHEDPFFSQRTLSVRLRRSFL